MAASQFYKYLYQVTDGGLKALSSGPSFCKLKELHIDGCQQLTSLCGSYLQAFPCISMLSFYDCPGLLKSEWFERYLLIFVI